MLFCPNLDATNILYNVLKTTTSVGVTVGSILMGSSHAAHTLTPKATVRRVFNMTAFAASQKTIK
jgi:malate dehydrogenase (oxaloacetate-decarboxylating)(NADP+)